MRYSPKATLVIAAATILACSHADKVGSTGSGGASGSGSSSDARGAGGASEQGNNPRPGRARLPPRGGRPTVAASPTGIMQPGAARHIQEALRAKGYLDEVTGELDERTSAALRRFQRDQDLAQTGAPDR